MKSKKYIVDTTLRDGEQKPGFAMSKEQKIKIARLLDEAGIYQIEAGIPAMGECEIEAIIEIKSIVKRTIISAWCRLNPKDIESAFCCEPDIIHISVPVSYAQIYTKLNKNKVWIIKNVILCAEMALNKGYEVTIGFEDASRADASFMMKLANELKKRGVNRIRFADTVGVLSPMRTYEIIRDIIRYTDIEIEFHAHNDLGMAIANSIMAAKAGAKYIDTTIFGIGERVGNCDYEKFITAASSAFELCTTRVAALKVEDNAKIILSKTS